MWQAISQRLSDELMFDFKIRERTRVEGGDINECYMISDGEQRYFVKVNSREFQVKFEAEADNLKELRATDTVYVPELVLFDNCKESAYLILNYIATKPLDNGKASYQLGESIAKLHQWGEQQEYGFDQDNYLGATLQPNQWRKKWSRFFSEQRIGWQLKLLEEKGISFGHIDDIVETINERLINHHPKPSLLHGDLWHGNVANTAFGPLCYDPACYWGDRECDIAMTELFEGFQPEFYQGYESIAPLDLGYSERKPIYNLYHILNHCNLFGGHYLDEADQYFSGIL
ncbi:fructosamine kinase family protein [Vibrio sp. SCSIO 43137]|uniref:fructosamine kinase family protein n=1 Tax=Vibrio sp. SCSIO 43137 TaxID=3021011 RepID=UPI0023073B15|nr:fructosamine kinase family protein [Vibrio sp. SCSIO 43137]WCE31054.1 fructosamine kinase family protein [Vibrio sp. SCSIO 43137]